MAATTVVFVGQPLQALGAAGSLDPTFGTGGKVTTDLGGTDDRGNAVVLQADGKIVVAGGFHGPGDFALVRYNPDGSLDTSFDGDGVPHNWKDPIYGHSTQ
jgi:uncharacterized delta-60 repeat protein